MLAALLMLKNEETSVKATLHSIRDHIKHVIVFDTGSTDNTLDVIRNTCRRNKQTVHIKQSTFHDFAVSRNESIDFAETIARAHPIDFILLLDAGDEFQCAGSKRDLTRLLQTISPTCNFGIVKKQWLETTGTIEHYDVRCIRVRKGCRYDVRYPVHETFKDRTVENMIFLNDTFILYQNRLIHGASSTGRFLKDVVMLSSAPITKRNYYYLGQTYMNMNDYENAYKYNLLAFETKDEDLSINLDTMEDPVILLRLMNCAIFLKKEHDTVFDYFQRIIKINANNIDAYIYLFKYCIDNDMYDCAKPHIRVLAGLTKPVEGARTLINHNYYDYLRWHFISTICLKTGDYEYGKMACIKANNTSGSIMDKINLQLFDNNIARCLKNESCLPSNEVIGNEP
jgi:glycosyltransferase involved in cell wall biosynthesis